MIASIDEVTGKWFDYVIVGGGTAGLTLAARLSEDPALTILVLEAGEANIDDPAILRPASFGTHFGNGSYAWNHQTIKQAGLNDRESFWFRGKGLGGSSGINFLCWSKPPMQDIDDFELLGNPGWNWENYQKHIQKTEGFIEPQKSFQQEHRMNFSGWKIGRNGPLTLTYPATIGEGEMNVRQTILNAGLPVAPQPVDGDPCGYQFMVNTVDPIKHTRSYATTAFYLPNKNRRNLAILVSAHAYRVPTEHTENGTLKALGVEFEYQGQVYSVNARRDVILSAGSLKSPQLLELSGIGNRNVLEKIHVPLKLELPGVGKNVQEHLYLGLTWELKDDVKWDTIDIFRDPDLVAKHLELHASGSGLFSTGLVGFTFFTLDMIASPERAAQIHSLAKATVQKMVSNGAAPALIEQNRILLDRLEPGGTGRSPGCEIISFPGYIPGGQPNLPENGKTYISLLAALNHCFSRGTIHAVSDDPSIDPEYDPRYFEQSIDLEILLELVKFTRGLADIAPLKDMVVKELNPGIEIQTDDELREWCKAGSGSTFHTAGPCSMLPKDKGGVVDPTLKVYGTSNLRVVDLSVVPLHFAAHSLATCYAIAEQAAEIIRRD